VNPGKIRQRCAPQRRDFQLVLKDLTESRLLASTHRVIVVHPLRAATLLLVCSTFACSASDSVPAAQAGTDAGTDAATTPEASLQCAD